MPYSEFSNSRFRLGTILTETFVFSLTYKIIMRAVGAIAHRSATVPPAQPASPALLVLQALTPPVSSVLLVVLVRQGLVQAPPALAPAPAPAGLAEPLLVLALELVELVELELELKLKPLPPPPAPRWCFRRRHCSSRSSCAGPARGS